MYEDEEEDDDDGDYCYYYRPVQWFMAIGWMWRESKIMAHL